MRQTSSLSRVRSFSAPDSPVMDKPRQLKLGAFLHPSGHHIAAWRHPDAYAAAAVDFGHYTALARTAERGLFDMIFLADMTAMRNWPLDTSSRVHTYVASFEPITLLSALATVTNHIGLVATATTTYNEPFHVARKFARSTTSAAAAPAGTS